METKYKRKKEKEGEPKQRSAFWEFMGGDFLLDEKVIRFYPYIFFLFLLGALIIFNENWIDAKKANIKTLNEEYKNTVSELKEHNQFIPYDSTKRLINLLEEQGFQKDNKNLYKVPIKYTKND